MPCAKFCQCFKYKKKHVYNAYSLMKIFSLGKSHNEWKIIKKFTLSKYILINMITLFSQEEWSVHTNKHTPTHTLTHTLHTSIKAKISWRNKIFDLQNLPTDECYCCSFISQIFFFLISRIFYLFQFADFSNIFSLILQFKILLNLEAVNWTVYS